MLRVCLTLFNLQGARRFRQANEWYLITDSRVCQALFSSFSKLFCSFSSWPCLSRTAWIYYHPFLKKSTPNFQFFRNFSTFFGFLWIHTPKKPYVSRIFHISAASDPGQKTRTASAVLVFCKQNVLRRKKETAFRLSLLCWRYLFSRPVSRQVSSA